METMPQIYDREKLFQKAEARVNRFNLSCITWLILLAIFSATLNELDIFTVDEDTMRVSMCACAMLFAVPILVYLIHDKCLHREDSVLNREWFKYLIVTSAFLGLAVLCMTLTFQAVILMAIPPILAAQYRDRKRLLLWTLVGTVLLVPVSVYGGFFYGTPDRNLLKGVTSTDVITMSDRIALATPERMLELLPHHVLPRLLCVSAIAALAFGITNRNHKLLDEQAELTEQIRSEMERRNSLQTRVIEALATLIETRDVGTGEHVIRTKKYVGMIARAMQGDEQFKDQLSDSLIEEIESAASLHDVGKIAVSDVILLKPGRLTNEEFEEMKKHSAKGGQIIRNIFSTIEDDATFLKIAEEIAVSHHEKWNGKGYPNGLSGEEIPLPARIMAVADVYDALVSVRVYKPSMTPEDALDLIESESGTHFDPKIIRVVTGMRQELIDAAKAPVTQ
ncbi:MAG: HD domain-containing protein [Clostridia bacterium]|nr:HD domain-containing protein [Clostridia bacterium]